MKMTNPNSPAPYAWSGPQTTRFGQITPPKVPARQPVAAQVPYNPSQGGLQYNTADQQPQQYGPSTGIVPPGFNPQAQQRSPSNPFNSQMSQLIAQLTQAHQPPQVPQGIAVGEQNPSVPQPTHRQAPVFQPWMNPSQQMPFNQIPPPRITQPNDTTGMGGQPMQQTQPMQSAPQAPQAARNMAIPSYAQPVYNTVAPPKVPTGPSPQAARDMRIPSYAQPIYKR